MFMHGSPRSYMTDRQGLTWQQTFPQPDQGLQLGCSQQSRQGGRFRTQPWNFGRCHHTHPQKCLLGFKRQQACEKAHPPIKWFIACNQSSVKMSPKPPSIFPLCLWRSLRYQTLSRQESSQLCCWGLRVMSTDLSVRGSAGMAFHISCDQSCRPLNHPREYRIAQPDSRVQSPLQCVLLRFDQARHSLN